MLHVQVIEQVRAQQEDARILLAGKLLKRVDDYLLDTREYGRKERKIAVAMLEGELKDSIDELRKRAAECASTLTDWHSVCASGALDRIEHI